ncbi:MAG: Holliday junction resolvase RuvX, partial [Proteobacteria bacterium]
TGTATGISSVRTSDSGDHFTAIADLIREWNPRGLVVGLPLDVEGRETGACRAVRVFGQRLGADFGLPVYWVNEYLTSQDAQARLTETMRPGKRFSRRKQVGRDLLAAELILRSYIESLPPRR